MRGKTIRTSKGRWFYAVELFIDTLIVALSYWAGFRLQRPYLFPDNLPDVMFAVLFLSAIALIVFLMLKTYRCGQRMYMQSMFDIIIAILIIAFAGVVFDFAIKGIGVWRRTLMYSMGLQILAFTIFKYLAIKIHAKVIKPRDCVIIGKDFNAASKIAIRLLNSESHLYQIKYILKQDAAGLHDYLKEFTQVFICSTCDTQNKTVLIEYCAVNNIDCAVIPSLKDIIINSGRPGNINDMLLLNMVVKTDTESRFAKRLIDLVVSLIGIIVAAPIMAITYLLVFAQDRSNPIYTQTRLSRGNKKFTIYKFRTMVIGAEKHTGAVLAVHNDERITKLGKFLRASRIDELPQLFNVLLGGMSIVGPRPERPEIAEQASVRLPEFEYRTLVKPGLTGYAQVIGRYDTDFADKLLFDLYYVNNHSLWLDLRIMFRTIRVLFTPSVTRGVSELPQESLEECAIRHGYTVRTEQDQIVFLKDMGEKSAG